MVTRGITDDPLGEVVRRRLDVLLAEIPARRMMPVPTSPDGSDFDEERSDPSIDGRSSARSTRRPAADENPGRSGSSRRIGAARPAGRRTDQAGPDSVGSDEWDPDVVGPASQRSAKVRLPSAEVVGRAWAFARGHAVVVGIIVLSGCLWGGYSLLQTKTTPVAVAVTQPTLTPVTSGLNTPLPASVTPTPARPVVVHVLGAVRDPGVVELPEGARVADALEAAGGLTRNARPGELNLAALVADGSQIVVGSKSDPGGEVREGNGGAEGNSGSATLSLNTATLAQLDTLPGVGPVTAQKILDWRSEHGRFSRVEELQEVDGIGPKSYAEISGHVRV
jgi:competence protein ComEA